MPDPAEPPEDAPEIPTETSQRPAARVTVRPRKDWRAAAGNNWRAISSVALLGIGITLVVLGWYGAAYTNIITEQIPYLISGGLLGLGLIIVAGFMAFSAAAERDNHRLHDAIVRALRAGALSGAAEASSSSPNGHDVFVVPGGRSYHNAGCPIIESKSGVQQLATADAARAGYAACKLCDTGD